MNTLPQLQSQIDQIREQLEELLVHQAVWKKLNDAWKRNEHNTFGGDFHEFIRLDYIAFVGTAVRRQMDRDERNKPVSLYRVMNGLKSPDNRAEITEQKFVERLRAKLANAPDDIAKRYYRTANKGRPGDIDAAKIDDDIREMQATTDNVVAFVDRVIAHSDPKGSKVTATYGELDASIEKLVETFNRYRILLGTREISRTVVEGRSDVEDAIKRIWP